MAPRTLDCSTVAPKIWDYLDGELSTEHRELVRVHVSGCTYCQAQLEYREAFLDAVQGSIGTKKTPPALRERVLAALFAAA